MVVAGTIDRLLQHLLDAHDPRYVVGQELEGREGSGVQRKRSRKIFKRPLLYIVKLYTLFILVFDRSQVDFFLTYRTFTTPSVRIQSKSFLKP